jgi:hypothetical protein
VLFITFVASLPIPRYNRPIRIPTVRWEISLSLVKVWNISVNVEINTVLWFTDRNGLRGKFPNNLQSFTYHLNSYFNHTKAFFLSYLMDFSYFSVNFFHKVAGHWEQVKNGL